MLKAALVLLANDFALVVLGLIYVIAQSHLEVVALFLPSIPGIPRKLN
jgi:hypothetical protein